MDKTKTAQKDPITITYGFHATNLFGGWPDKTLPLYNQTESAKLYAQQVRARMQAEYPDAEITVPYDTDTGALPSPLRCRYNDITAAEATRDEMLHIEFVEQVAQSVYHEYQWIVPTEQAMHAAHYSRQLDLNETLNDYSGSDRAAARAVASGQNPIRAQSQYMLGVLLLELFRVEYTHCYARSTVPPPIADNVAGWITVSAGHIATIEAQRLALFRPRF